MMPSCSHGYEFDPDDKDQCPIVCADPNCGHRCHWHYGQCCDAGGMNRCAHCDEKRSGGRGEKNCEAWTEPE